MDFYLKKLIKKRSQTIKCVSIEKIKNNVTSCDQNKKKIIPKNNNYKQE